MAMKSFKGTLSRKLSRRTTGELHTEGLCEESPLELLEAAEASRSLGRCFRFLRAILPPTSAAREKRSVSSSASLLSFMNTRKAQPDLDEFVALVQKFLDLVAAVRAESYPGCSWSSVFHSYMADHFAAGSAAEVPPWEGDQHHAWINMFEPASHLEQAQHVLKAFVSAGQQDLEGLLNIREGCLKSALELMAYLQSHRVDPYNALIGLEPTPELLEQLSLSGGAAHSAPGIDLLACVVRWAGASPESLQEVFQDIRNTAATIRGVDRLGQGDLVIIAEPKTRPVFARFTGVRQGDFFEVSTKPEEVDGVACYPKTALLPLSEYLREKIASRRLPELEQFVRLPSDELFAQVQRIAVRACYAVLSRVGVTEEVYVRAKTNAATFSDLLPLQNASDVLSSAIADIENFQPHPVFGPAEIEIASVIAGFRKNITDRTLFLPSSKHTLHQIANVDEKKVILKTITKMHSVVDVTQSQLSDAKQQWIDGTRKNELVSWWLDAIEEKVLAFLDKLGYQYKAMPENYVEDAPDDLEAIRTNTRILKDVLTPGEDKFGVQTLIKRIQGMVGPKIDEFVDNGLYILSEKFGRTIDDRTMAEAEKELKENPDLFDPVELEWIDDLMKDINYLQEMRRMEDPEYAKHNEVSFHIVPLSGLTLGVLVRLENECKTILELWEPRVEVQVSVLSSEKFPLHRAVSSDSLAVVQQLLEDKDINEQDISGWTPLHVAASKPDQLDICEYLLKQPELNPTLRNNDGNTAMHYIVRNRCSTDQYPVLAKVVKMMIARGMHPNQRNKNGESPMHTSCLSNNPQTVLILLQAGGDPNIATPKGDTCLHYAIQKGNHAVVKALLSFGAKKELKSAKGLNAIELAEKMKRVKILELLRPSASRRKSAREFAEKKHTGWNVGSPVLPAQRLTRAHTPELVVECENSGGAFASRGSAQARGKRRGSVRLGARDGHVSKSADSAVPAAPPAAASPIAAASAISLSTSEVAAIAATSAAPCAKRESEGGAKGE
eukprot:TRINITY_DN2336_c0_g1_i1.p1 TRINITY_DN2336_c0_g1~~TRINITY_DN2336_c0_g1_i1.p1  ORF type:complete len:1008 (+),score=287.45 TRINITY_DN2336_c0_g1_i1:266-3289(+)